MSKEVSVTGMKYRSAKLWEMIMAPACAGNNICMYMCMVYASYAGSEGYGIATAVVGVIITLSRILDAVESSYTLDTLASNTPLMLMLPL